MPKLVNAMSAPDRFNFMTALIGFLLRNQRTTVQKVAAHFGVSEDQVRNAIRTIVVTEDQNPYGAKCFYNLEDWDIYEDGDVITLELDALGGAGAQDGAPRLDTREAAAIAMGLQYLKTLPEFAAESELDELIELLGKGAGGKTQTIVIHAPEIDADAKVLRTAVLEGKRVQFEYINQSGEGGTRRVDPIRIDPREKNWYLYGWCLDKQEIRKFRLDRMRNAIVLDEPIGEQAMKTIDLDDRAYTEKETDIEVTVALMPEAYSLLGEYQQVDEVKVQPNGEYVAVIRVAYLPNLGRLIARFGGKARVIEPAEARDIVREYALNVLGRQSGAADVVEG